MDCFTVKSEPGSAGIEGTITICAIVVQIAGKRDDMFFVWCYVYLIRCLIYVIILIRLIRYIIESIGKYCYVIIPRRYR